MTEVAAHHRFSDDMDDLRRAGLIDYADLRPYRRITLKDNIVDVLTAVDDVSGSVDRRRSDGPAFSLLGYPDLRSRAGCPQELG